MDKSMFIQCFDMPLFSLHFYINNIINIACRVSLLRYVGDKQHCLL